MKINLDIFSHLRLSKYISDKKIERVQAFEYMDDQWSGEIVGFTQILQREKEPDVTRAVLVDLQDGQTHVGERILSEIGIPLKKGMELREIEGILAGTAIKATSFLKDRKEYEYLKNADNAHIFCVIHNHIGLIHVSVLVGVDFISA